VLGVVHRNQVLDSRQSTQDRYRAPRKKPATRRSETGVFWSEGYAYRLGA
jgi:hypothetical protein